MYYLYTIRQRSQPILVMNFRATWDCLTIHAIAIDVVSDSILICPGCNITKA